MNTFLIFHRVLLDNVVHAYEPSQRSTLCGLDKRWELRVFGPTECPECIDLARAFAIRRTDRALGMLPVRGAS